MIFEWISDGTVGQTSRVMSPRSAPPPGLPPPSSGLTAEACNQKYIPWAFNCMQNPTATSDCFRRVTPDHLAKLAQDCGVDTSKFPAFDCAAHVAWALADLQKPDSRLKAKSVEVTAYLDLLKQTCGTDVWKTVYGDAPREGEAPAGGGTETKKDNTIWYVFGAGVVAGGLYLILR